MVNQSVIIVVVRSQFTLEENERRDNMLTTAQQQELDKRFDYHAPPNEEVKDLHEDIRRDLKRIATFVLEHLPDSRERSTALTKLEEAMFWSNASIARHHSWFTQ